MARNNEVKVTIDLDREDMEGISRDMSLCLLDTNVFTPSHAKLETDFFSSSLFRGLSNLDPNLFLYYREYFTMLFDVANINGNLTSVPPVFEELARLKRIFRNRRKGLRKMLGNSSLRKVFYDNRMEQEVKYISRIAGIYLGDSMSLLDEITKMLSEHNLYVKLFSNKEKIDDYLNLSKLVNFLYNYNFKINERICADDGLVAASILLLRELKQQVGIISSDGGIIKRLRTIDSFFEAYRSRDEGYNETHELLRYVGISVFGRDFRKSSRFYNSFSNREIQRKRKKTLDVLVTDDNRIDIPQSLYFQRP